MISPCKHEHHWRTRNWKYLILRLSNLCSPAAEHQTKAPPTNQPMHPPTNQNNCPKMQEICQHLSNDRLQTSAMTWSTGRSQQAAAAAELLPPTQKWIKSSTTREPSNELELKSSRKRSSDSIRHILPDHEARVGTPSNRPPKAPTKHPTNLQPRQEIHDPSASIATSEEQICDLSQFTFSHRSLITYRIFVNFGK